MHSQVRVEGKEVERANEMKLKVLLSGWKGIWTCPSLTRVYCDFFTATIWFCPRSASTASSTPRAKTLEMERDLYKCAEDCKG